jgi:uncharacterized protein (TIGR02117 family)
MLTKPSLLRHAIKIAILVPAVLTVILLFYFCAAAVLGMIPVNRDFQAAPDGIDIYIRANQVHADILLPIQSPAFDWRTLLDAREFHPSDPAEQYIAFGWGDRGFYLETPGWSDLRASTALIALSGQGRSVVHIDAQAAPVIAADVRRMRISAAQLQLLTQYIDASFARSDAGTVKRIEGVRYGLHDAFYEARGSYSAFVTCNEWVRRALSQAGIRTAAWAPFSWAVLYQVP